MAKLDNCQHSSGNCETSSHPPQGIASLNSNRRDIGTCGTSEHTKAHAGLQGSSRSQVLTIHFRVHTNTPVLFTSSSILKTFQLKGFTMLSYTSVSKPFASYSLLFSHMFCSLHPAFSLQLLIFLTLLLSCLTMFSLLISCSALDS